MMRILIYGAGVLGSAVAHLLMQGKHEVTMLARGIRAQQLEQSGLVIRHHFQKRTTTDWPRVIRKLEADDRYDLIFTVMKYSDLEAVLPNLADNISENIVMIGNNPDIAATEAGIQRLAGGRKRLSFGFQLGGGIRREDGTVISIQTGAGKLIVGALNGEIEFLLLLQQAFADSRCKLVIHSNIDAWLKTHMISVVPLAAAWSSRGGDVKGVASDRVLLRQVVEAMAEGLELLEAAGYPAVPALQAQIIRRHKAAVRVLLSLYHRLPAARLIDGSFAEIESLDAVFRGWAQTQGQTAPAWNRLLQEAQNHRQVISN
ncbi:ketopantoate reductase family protein [Saccharibacillus deserti]|uniref:ketopantoate reductase family protein n=1 Tax=Saccharibacillus deserti TaxID=1634444 RepID=UPI00155469F0|nr:ketopantoate reductase family protein [Saccharibacillus deserti]